MFYSTVYSASNIDVGIIAGTLLVYTTPCFEALTIISGYSITPDFFQKVKDIFFTTVPLGKSKLIQFSSMDTF